MLQFEKKFSVRTCNIMLGGWAVLLLTDLYKYNIDFVQLARRGSEPHMEVLGYLTGLDRRIHFAQLWFGSIGLIFLYGLFQRFAKNREMAGLFTWKQRDQRRFQRDGN